MHSLCRLCTGALRWECTLSASESSCALFLSGSSVKKIRKSFVAFTVLIVFSRALPISSRCNTGGISSPKELNLSGDRHIQTLKPFTFLNRSPLLRLKKPRPFQDFRWSQIDILNKDPAVWSPHCFSQRPVHKSQPPPPLSNFQGFHILCGNTAHTKILQQHRATLTLWVRLQELTYAKANFDLI